MSLHCVGDDVMYVVKLATIYMLLSLGVVLVICTVDTCGSNDVVDVCGSRVVVLY